MLSNWVREERMFSVLYSHGTFDVVAMHDRILLRCAGLILRTEEQQFRFFSMLAAAEEDARMVTASSRMRWSLPSIGGSTFESTVIAEPDGVRFVEPEICLRPPGQWSALMIAFRRCWWETDVFDGHAKKRSYPR
ncbi:hypothetical protein LZC95_20195 [Pendulispora brunnea]|uniref:Uncharacterized protein n=1 Tax=Pendulispora brunnea TaxID=2905690 RepID=A0ABZ2KNG6_9BACT